MSETTTYPATEPNGRRRWPKGDRQRPHPGEDGHHIPNEPGEFAPFHPSGKDWQEMLSNLAPTALIGEGLYQLDNSGIAAEQYRAQYRALHITSGSAFPLIIAAMPRQQSAPGLGPGVALVPPYGDLTVNMTGYAWSVYGGVAGDQVAVQALSKVTLPLASAGTYSPVKTVWTNAAGGAGASLSANGSSGPLPVSPFGELGLQVAVLTAPTGTNPTLTVTLYGEDAQGNLYPFGSTPPLGAVSDVQIDVGVGLPGLAGPTGMASGQATAPLANASLCTIATANLPALGPYLITVTAYIDGTTVPATDDDNLKLVISGGGVSTSQHFSVPSNGAIVTYQTTALLNSVESVQVTAIANASASAVYHATVTATPVATNHVVPAVAAVGWALAGTTPVFPNVELTLIGRR